MEECAMKRLIFISLFFLSLCIVLPLNASELIIRVFNGSSFYVTINGHQYQSTSGTVSITGLNKGNHHLEIYKPVVLGNGFTNNRVYSGYVNIPHHKRLIAELDRFNSFRIIRKENMNNSSYGNSNSYGNAYGNNYNNAYGNSYGYNNGANYSSYDYNSYDYANTGNYAGYSYPTYGMMPETLDALLGTLDRESFDDRRLSIAFSAISMNGITCMQLKEIMFMLSFDSNRLKLAKRSYDYISDKNNVFLLNDAFTFSSNADAFFRYIGSW